MPDHPPLSQLQSLLESVIEATDEAISIADENGQTVVVNLAYSRLTGLPKEAVLNRSFMVDIDEGMHMKVLKTGIPVRNVRMKVGPTKREVIVNVGPIVLDGKVRGSIGAIHDVSEMASLCRELTQARQIIRQLSAKYDCNDIIGSSHAMERAREQARRAAAARAALLLRGESGTGKELFAYAIHNASDRKEGHFVRVNCGALAASILEGELFGCEPGAFAGVRKDGKKGCIEAANGGTLFLDEIGELDLGLQSRLLRVLQEGEMTRVGGTAVIPVDVRVIAATKASLEARIRGGTFRQDLFHRLNETSIHIPPIRERREDIPILAEHLIFRLNKEYGSEVESVAPEAMEALMAYNWPGNVREMENTLGRAIINMNPHERVIERKHLPQLSGNETAISTTEEEVTTPCRETLLETHLMEAEKSAIRRALELKKGNKTEAAKALGISLRSLYYKMQRHGP